VLIPWEGVQGAIGKGETHATKDALYQELRGWIGFVFGLFAETCLYICAAEAAVSSTCAA
jgi:hypothetical protein